MFNYSLFHYLDKNEGSIYSFKPPGYLNVDRLLKNLAPWKKYGLSSELKQKSLILADWTAAGWSRKKLHAAQATLKGLLDKGFPLYTWQNGSVELLTKDNLSDLLQMEYRSNMRPSVQKIIVEAAVKQHSLSQNQIHIIDDYWLDYLISDEAEPPVRQLSIEALTNTPHDISEVLSVIKQSIPLLTSIIRDEMSVRAGDMITTVETHFPTTKIISLYKTILLDDPQPVTHADSLRITPAELASIETVMLTCESKTKSIKVPELVNIFSGIQRLKRLHLSCNLSTLRGIFGDITNFTHLEELIIKNSNISSVDLRRILLESTHLKGLFLENCMGLSDFDASGIRLLKLEELHIRQTPISGASLTQLLLGSPSIKAFELNGCKNLMDFDASSLSLEQLEKLNLSDIRLTQESFQNLLRHATKLKTFKLTYYNHLIATLPQMPNIEELIIDCSSLNHANLIDVLTHAPRVKRLSLLACTWLIELADENLNLPRLKELCIRYPGEANSALPLLLKIGSNLKKLNLTDSDANAVKTFFYEPGLLPLKNLEELYISDFDLPLDHLIHILAKATRLKNLGLHYFKSLDELIQTDMHVTNIEVLDIQYTALSASTISALLNQTRTLKVLNLSNAEIENDEAIEAIPSLATLEQLFMAQTLIHSNDRDAIIRSAPNLKRSNIQTFNQEVSESEEEDEEEDVELPALVAREENACLSMDADTSMNPNANFSVTRYFSTLIPNTPEPIINHYRLQSFNTIHINNDPCEISEAFKLGNEESEHLVPCNLIHTHDLKTLGERLALTQKTHTYYLGQQSFALTNEWQAIASMSSDETLTHAQVSPPSIMIDIRYSPRDNLYYIRSLTPAYITLSFLLAIKTSPTAIALPDKIQKLATLVANFREGALVTTQPHPTGHDFFKQMIQQRVGSCRHRALVFKKLMQTIAPGVPVRMIINECHAYVEVKLGSLWNVIDLGGYSAQLTINTPVDHEQYEENVPEACSPKPLIQENPLTSIFEKELETWNKNRPFSMVMADYCQDIFELENVKKRLIELSSDSAVHTLQLGLQEYCSRNARPFFYIHTPNELVCSAAFIQRKPGSNMGVLVPGPGGPLHAFISAQHDEMNTPVLIINYNNFEADDIARLNSLLDDERYVDEVRLPEQMLIIGLINNHKPNHYEGEDFYSRFDRVETFSMDEEPQPKPLFREKSSCKEPTTIIPLYHGTDWEERLLGYWTILDDAFCFIEGALVPALAKGLPIELQNAPWENDNFRMFWQQAYIRGKIHHAGLDILIPNSLQLISHEGYDWPMLCSVLKLEARVSPTAMVLNSVLFSDYFIRYTFDDTQKSLSIAPGLLELHTGQSLHINLTSAINEDEWAALLDACHQQRVSLTVHCAASIELPACLTPKLLQSPLMEPTLLIEWNGSLTNHTMAIISTDIDATLAHITSSGPTVQIMDVSECESDDLLIATIHHYCKITTTLAFKQEKHALMVALEQHQQVILKGFFSPTLVDALAPLLLFRQHQSKANGQLILLSATESFHYLPSTHHTVDIEIKRMVLQKTFSPTEIEALPPQVWDEGYSSLQARLFYLRSHPDALSSDLAWQGLHTLPSRIHLKKFDPKNSQALADDFNRLRLLAINQRLAHAPYVFLTGLTAVGKTSFVEKYLNTESSHLYQGRNQARQWAEDSSLSRKILFIDEANLSQRQWSEFKDLFNHPPSILIDGQYYRLTDQHKVLFAGNPIHYGDERKLAQLFTEHGNALVFDPMPLDYIYEKILRPVFEGSALYAYTEHICIPILDVYRFICEHSEDRILISPRELQMMALLVYSYVNQEGAHIENSIHAAKHYAYYLATELVLSRDHAVFDARFKPSIGLTRRTKPMELNSQHDFLITASRELICQQLDGILTLQEFKRDLLPKDLLQNDTQRYGGLGGLILEGEPGCGKSKMVIASLSMRGYEEVLVHEDIPHKSLPAKPYYLMQASLQIEEKKRLLLTAFNEGAIVVCDEINGSPMMERFLNQLLMGRTPDDASLLHPGGTPPRRPGFFIIGTQNPASMQGRRQPSMALARRLMTLSVPAYVNDEMMSILINKGVGMEVSGLLVAAYEKNVQKAHRESLSPSPVFRDLLKVARPYMVENPTAESDLLPDSTLDLIIPDEANILATHGLFLLKRSLHDVDDIEHVVSKQLRR